MKLILTGSEGFIGKHLQVLLDDECIDTLCYDYKLGNEAVDCIPYIQDADAVIHLAAQTSVFNTDIEQIRKDNIDTFIKIAMECERVGTKLVYASSSTAYNTTSMYGLSKRFDEDFARIYCPSAIGVRLHNVYGDNPRKGTLLWCLLNKEVELYNNGENIRCYTWVNDVCRALLKAVESEEQLVNVVNYEPITTKEFADKVARYKTIRYKCVPTVREKDNPIQKVNDAVPLLDVGYHKVDEVLERILKAR